MNDSQPSDRGAGKPWWNVVSGQAENVVQAREIHGDVVFNLFEEKPTGTSEPNPPPRAYNGVDTTQVYSVPALKPSAQPTKVRRSLAVSHDGSQIAIGDSAGRINVLSPADNEVRPLRLGGQDDSTKTDRPSYLCYMPTGDAIVATHPLGVWDATTGQSLATLMKREDSATPFAVAVSADGKFIAVSCLVRIGSGGSARSIVRIFDLLADREIRTITVKEVVFGLRFDAPSLLWLTGNRQVYMWDCSTNDKPLPLRVYNHFSLLDPIRHMNTPVYEFGAIYGFDVRSERLQSGNWGIFACWDRAARLGMSDNGTIYFPVLPHNGPVYDAVLHDEGTLAATASRDGTVRVFSLTNRREIGRVIHGAPVTAVRFLPGTSKVVSTGTDDTVRISSVT